VTPTESNQTTKLPVARRISWQALGVQLAALAVSLAACRLLLGPHPWSLLCGVLVYLVYARGARAVLLRHHAAGIAALRARQFQEAVLEFEASYAFLERHPSIDRYRAVLLLSPSAQSFREMALLNAAFAHLQLGHAAEAKALYQRTLGQFPASATAAAALSWLAAVERGGRALQ
jgi:tetratricopeptide (TPR) repeat protein